MRGYNKKTFGKIIYCVCLVNIASYDNNTGYGCRSKTLSVYSDINLLHSFFLELHQSGAQLCLDPAPVNDTGMELGLYGMGLGL